VRLVSRNGRDPTRRFAGIAAAIAQLSARSLVLDARLRSKQEYRKWLAATPEALREFSSYVPLALVS